MMPRRIVVIDDNVQAAETLAIILRYWGHDAYVAFDGPTGLAAVSEYRPDVVILDIELPSMSGLMWPVSSGPWPSTTTRCSSR